MTYGELFDRLGRAGWVVREDAFRGTLYINAQLSDGRGILVKGYGRADDIAPRRPGHNGYAASAASQALECPPEELPLFLAGLDASTAFKAGMLAAALWICARRLEGAVLR